MLKTLTPAAIHHRLQAVYGENTVNRTTVNRWAIKFRETPRPKKFKTVPSAGKIILTVFWDSQRVYMTEFLEYGNTVNSARYTETIKKTYGGGCVELGGQHRRFCCCMRMQDRTLLAQ